jgi:hypothetical protein
MYVLIRNKRIGTTSTPLTNISKIESAVRDILPIMFDPSKDATTTTTTTNNQSDLDPVTATKLNCLNYYISKRDPVAVADVGKQQPLVPETGEEKLIHVTLSTRKGQQRNKRVTSSSTKL